MQLNNGHLKKPRSSDFLYFSSNLFYSNQFPPRRLVSSLSRLLTARSTKPPTTRCPRREARRCYYDLAAGLHLLVLRPRAHLVHGRRRRLLPGLLRPPPRRARRRRQVRGRRRRRSGRGQAEAATRRAVQVRAQVRAGTGADSSLPPPGARLRSGRSLLGFWRALELEALLREGLGGILGAPHRSIPPLLSPDVI